MISMTNWHVDRGTLRTFIFYHPIPSLATVCAIRTCNILHLIFFIDKPHHNTVPLRKLANEFRSGLKAMQKKARKKKTQLQEYFKGCERLSTEFEAETQTLRGQIRSTMESQVCLQRKLIHQLFSKHPLFMLFHHGVLLALSRGYFLLSYIYKKCGSVTRLVCY